MSTGKWFSSSEIDDSITYKEFPIIKDFLITQVGLATSVDIGKIFHIIQYVVTYLSKLSKERWGWGGGGWRERERG